MNSPDVQRHIEQLLEDALRDREPGMILLAEMLCHDYGSEISQPVSAHSITVAQAEREHGWAELLDEVEGEDTLFRPGRTQVTELIEFLSDLVITGRERSQLRQLLIDAFHRHDAVDFGTAYRLALADITALEDRTPAGFADCIDELLCRHIDPLDMTFSFVEWYCRYLAEVDGNWAAAADLRAASRVALPIGRYDVARLDRLCEQIRDRELGRRPHVVFRIEDRTVGGWSVWRYPGGMVGAQPPSTVLYGKRLGGSEQPVESDEHLVAAIQEMLAKLPDLEVAEPAADQAPKPPVIEFMGDWEWLETRIEDIPLTPDGNLTLGRLAPVVVRLPSQEGDTSPVVYQRWHHAHNGGAANIQRLTGDGEAIEAMSPAMAICYRPVNLHVTLRRIWAAGVRIATWSRRGDDMTGFVNGHPLADLIYVLWKRRRARTCRDVVLLWDDPHWTFAGNRLEWRAAP